MLPVGGDAAGQSACGTEDDGLCATQEDAKAFLLHWGMEAADDAASGVAPAGGLVVGGEDNTAGAARGTEQSGLGQRQRVEVAEGG